MDASACPGCSERDARIADLERRLAELEARLKTDASNSSTPPSANPLDAKKPVTKKKSKRKRGGQPGHPPHLKQLLPPEQVTDTQHFVPAECANCHAELPREAGPDDPEPKRFQTIELPPIVLDVVEYQAHTRTCPCCGTINEATIPAKIREHGVGARLTAALSCLTGNLCSAPRSRWAAHAQDKTPQSS